MEEESSEESEEEGVCSSQWRFMEQFLTQAAGGILH
jgi:hypothetical protein